MNKIYFRQPPKFADIIKITYQAGNTMNIHYKELNENEICRDLFRQFTRRQTVVKCWRKDDGKWIIKDAPFIDDWSEDDYQLLVTCLQNTLATGGIVYGAFSGDALKGFVSVESSFFGSNNEYLDLTSLHVSEDMRGKGIGRILFHMAGSWAKEHGAEKLYISGHSAVETQAFYKAMGCVEAAEYNQQHAEAEPYDCQLEFLL